MKPSFVKPMATIIFLAIAGLIVVQLAPFLVEKPELDRIQDGIESIHKFNTNQSYPNGKIAWSRGTSSEDRTIKANVKSNECLIFFMEAIKTGSEKVNISGHLIDIEKTKPEDINLLASRHCKNDENPWITIYQKPKTTKP